MHPANLKRLRNSKKTESNNSELPIVHHFEIGRGIKFAVSCTLLLCNIQFNYLVDTKAFFYVHPPFVKPLGKSCSWNWVLFSAKNQEKRDDFFSVTSQN